MERSGRLPDDPKLVLPPRPRWQVVREHALTMAVFAVTTALAALGVATTGSLVWIVLGSLCLAGLVLEVLLVRGEAGFGPLLAADSDHVWLRAGGLLTPRSVRLDWAEISAVTLRHWHGRRGASGRYLAFELTAGGTEDLSADPYLVRRALRSSRMFGAPLAVSERRTGTFDDVFRELRGLAPDGVRFAHRT